MEKKPIGVIRWERFAQLLKRPVGRRMGCHIDVEEAARGVLHDHEDIEEAKGGGEHHAEITCDDRLSMIAHKRLPALGGPTMPSTVVHTLGHILADGPRRHTQAQLQQELVGNAFLSPGRILSRHTTDKGLQVRRNGWASACGLPAPEEPESLAMPAEKGGGLHNG